MPYAPQAERPSNSEQTNAFPSTTQVDQAPLSPTGFIQNVQGTLIAVYQPEALDQYITSSQSTPSSLTSNQANSLASWNHFTPYRATSHSASINHHRLSLPTPSPAVGWSGAPAHSLTQQGSHPMRCYPPYDHTHLNQIHPKRSNNRRDHFHGSKSHHTNLNRNLRTNNIHPQLSREPNRTMIRSQGAIEWIPCNSGR